MRACLTALAMIALLGGAARAELALEVAARLPGLVGIEPREARYRVAWESEPPAGARLEALRYDARGRAIVAGITAPEGRRTLSGRVTLVALVPTPARAIAAGEVLTLDALSGIEVDLLNARGDIVRSEAQVIDRAARRALSPGKPILTRDLKTALAVQRNELLTISAQVGAVSLRGRGKAIDAGALGETIRVQNIDSHKVITGVIVDRGLVEVSGAAR